MSTQNILIAWIKLSGADRLNKTGVIQMGNQFENQVMEMLKQLTERMEQGFS